MGPAGSSVGPAGSSIGPASSSSVRATGQARQLLTRYENSLHSTAPGAVGITSELVSQVGNWEPTVGGNNKIALLTGHVREVAATPTVARHSIVRWADGRKLPVQTISVRQAFTTLQLDGQKQSCYGCTPVTLGDARLTGIAVQTTRGNATVPAWSFAVRGSRVRVTVVAIDAAATVPALPRVGALPGPFVMFESAHPTGRRQLALTFVGAFGTGRVACGADYAATAIESRHAVAVLIREFPHHGPAGEVCSAVGYRRTATVQLTAPWLVALCSMWSVARRLRCTRAARLLFAVSRAVSATGRPLARSARGAVTRASARGRFAPRRHRGRAPRASGSVRRGRPHGTSAGW